MPWTNYPYIDEPNPGATALTSALVTAEFARVAAYADAGVATLTRVVTANVTGSYVLALGGDKDVLFVLTMTGNTSFTVSGLTAGASFTIELKQDSTGSRVATLPTAIKPGGTAFTLTTTPNAINVLSYYTPNGSSLRAFLVGAGLA